MANVMGIKRGVDLVLYTFVLATSVALFLIYLRYKQLDRTMTLLVRQLAIRSAREPESGVEAASLPSGLEAHGAAERD
jgi:hypothetical protein